MHYVYILYSEGHDTFYIGETSDPKQRLRQHNAGKVPSTRTYIPWRFMWLREQESRKEALQLEKKLKNLHSKTRLLAFIEKYASLNIAK